MSPNDTQPELELEVPTFHAVDEQRLGVAEDRSAIQRLREAADIAASQLRERARRLTERDARNGYAELFRTLMEEPR